MLGESKQKALNRLHALENKLRKNPDLKRKYVEFMREYSELKHMQQIEEGVTRNDLLLPPPGRVKGGKRNN